MTTETTNTAVENDQQPNHERDEQSLREFSQRVRDQTTAVRFSQTKLFTRKVLTAEQKAAAAEPFDALGTELSASKRIINIRDAAYKRVSSIQRAAKHYWISMTVPYPETGIRLIARENVERFEATIADYQTDLAEAEAELEENYQRLKEQAQEDLGTLFNSADYPDTLVGVFSISTDYPTVAPPNYLKEIHPELWQRQADVVSARFDTALQMAEDAYRAQLTRLVQSLRDSLRPIIVNKWQCPLTGAEAQQRLDDARLRMEQLASRIADADDDDISAPTEAELPAMQAQVEDAELLVRLATANNIETKEGGWLTITHLSDTKRSRPKGTGDDGLEALEEFLRGSGCTVIDTREERRQIRESATTNFVGFFENFRALNVGSDQELESLVNQAQTVVTGIGVSDLREDGDLRERVASSMDEIIAQLSSATEEREERPVMLADEV